MNANQKIYVHPSLSVVNYFLKKSHRLLMIRDQHIFVVAVMVEHHCVVFSFSFFINLTGDNHQIKFEFVVYLSL